MIEKTSANTGTPEKPTGPIDVIDFKDGKGIANWDDALVRGIITQDQYDNGYGFCWVDLKKS